MGLKRRKAKHGRCVKQKLKDFFQEKLEIHENIIIERAHRRKGKTARSNTA